MLVQIYGGAWQRGDSERDTPNFATLAGVARLGRVRDRLSPRAGVSLAGTARRRRLGARRGFAITPPKYGGDTSRVVLMGRSAGAHLAMLAAYRESAARGSRRGELLRPDRSRRLVPASASSRSARHSVGRGKVHRRAARFGRGRVRATRHRSRTRRARCRRRCSSTAARDHIVEARYGARLRDRLAATRHAGGVSRDSVGRARVRRSVQRAELAARAVPHGALSHLGRAVARPMDIRRRTRGRRGPGSSAAR